MEVIIEVTVLGKIKNIWDKDGKSYDIFKINYSQKGGMIVGQLKVPEEVYNSVEIAKKYSLEAKYGVGKNGGYISVIGFTANGKGGQLA